MALWNPLALLVDGILIEVQPAVDDVPAGIDRHLRISHRAVVVERVLLDDEAYGAGLIVALEGETVFAGTMYRAFIESVMAASASSAFIVGVGFTFWNDLKRPCSLELIEVDDEVGFPFVVGSTIIPTQSPIARLPKIW